LKQDPPLLSDGPESGLPVNTSDAVPVSLHGTAASGQHSNVEASLGDDLATAVADEVSAATLRPPILKCGTCRRGKCIIAPWWYCF
jgi:hypothetical protein